MTVSKKDFEELGTALAESAVMLEIEPDDDEWFQLIGPVKDRMYEANSRFRTEKFYDHIEDEFERIK